VDDGTHLRDALKIYNYFHQLNRAPEWGEITLSRALACLIPGSLLHPFSGKSASPKGTAGQRRLRLIEQHKCDEKSIDSKVMQMQGSAPPSLPTRGLDPGPAEELCIPSPVLPSTSSSQSGDNDFQIEVRMTA
jgi:hypothetical protein